MMKYPRSYIAILTAIGILQIVFQQFNSSAPKKLQYAYVIIYEHRLHYEGSNCLDQHLKEHLYSRLVDDELKDRGYSAYSVDAVASIDKIIIGIEHWGESEEIEIIAKSAVEAIKKKPNQDFVKQERLLVAFEDDILAKTPLFGASVTSALLKSASSPSLYCPPNQLRLAADDLSEWVPGDYQVYKSTETGQYELLSSSQTGMSNFSNPWDDFKFPADRNHEISTGLTSNILFVAYKGRAEPLSTAKLLAAIYGGIAGSALEAKDISSFGKAGFVIVGEYRDLVNVQEKLQKIFSSSRTSLLRLQYWQMAQKTICDLRTQNQQKNVELFDEQISHTYFEFAMQSPFCERSVDLSTGVADMSIVTNLIDVTETTPETLSESDQMLLNLCIPEKDFVKADLSVAAYALRQHLRYDLGLALNVRYSKIEGNCVKGMVIAPKQNSGALQRSFKKFDANSDEFSARYSSAYRIYGYRKGVSDRFWDHIDFKKGAVPNLFIYVI